MALEIFVNTGSGNGLLPDGIKPLPKPVLTSHQQGSLAFVPGQCLLNTQNINPKVVFEKKILQNHTSIS